MLNTVSLTGTGVLISLLAMGLKYFGIVVDENQVAAFVNNLAQIVAFVMIIVGQVRRKDLSFGLLRK